MDRAKVPEANSRRHSEISGWKDWLESDKVPGERVWIPSYLLGEAMKHI